MTATLKSLTPAQREEFIQQGFTTVRGVFNFEEVQTLNARTEAFERDHADSVPWAFDIKANLLLDWVYELGRDERVLDIVEDLIGPDILMTNAIFRIKEPGSTVDYGWHQDSARIEVKPGFVIVYIALSKATPENGCLRVIPATHDRVRPFTLVENPAQKDRKVARVVGADPSLAIDAPLAPGDMVVFHCNAVHGSAPNVSDERRVAILYDFTPAAGQQNTGKGSGQLVRGENSHGYWAIEPTPEPSLTDNNVLNRRRILTEYPENALMGPLAAGSKPSFPDRSY